MKNQKMGNLAAFQILFASLSGLILILFALFVLPPFLFFFKTAPVWYIWCMGFIPFYLLYCILSCTQILKGRLLVVSGITMHVGLAAFATIVLAKTGNLFFLIVSILYGVMWVVLCVARVRKEAP
jgi:hypothetical protein